MSKRREARLSITTELAPLNTNDNVRKIYGAVFVTLNDIKMVTILY